MKPDTNRSRERFKNHPSQIVKAECVRMHTQLNYGVSAIAKRTNTNKALVRKWLIQQGVYTVGGRKKSPIKPKGRPIEIRLQIEAMRLEIMAIRRIESASNRHIQTRRHYAVKKFRKRLDSCPVFRARFYLRKRLKNVIRSHRLGAPTKSISHVIGCTSEHLMEHIQSKFRDGMTWGNMGEHWELDHVRPLSSFDLTKYDEVSAAGHWTNIQPLLVGENRSKGDRYAHESNGSLANSY